MEPLQGLQHHQKLSASRVDLVAQCVSGHIAGGEKLQWNQELDRHFQRFVRLERQNILEDKFLDRQKF